MHDIECMSVYYHMIIYEEWMKLTALRERERESERMRDRGRAINWCSLLHITCKCDLVHFPSYTVHVCRHRVSCFEDGLD